MTARFLFTRHPSPLGDLRLVSVRERLCGLYFDNHRPAPSETGWVRDDGSHFNDARAWLDAYFSGSPHPQAPPHALLGGTPFQRTVWDSLHSIPFGKTKTYSEVAALIGSPKAARAVGAAVARNPLSILIPCHRVIGGDGSPNGYAGGTNRKRILLTLEGIDLPKNI